MSDNRVILAVAGGRKTEGIIEEALADPANRTLITTYTTENLRQITSRIQARTGIIPPHIRTSGWLSFLINEGIRPYQFPVLGQVGLIRRLNFKADRGRYVRRSERAYWLDRNNDVLRDAVADLACLANTKSKGRVISRLEQMFDQIYIDEVQDLVGHDLEFIELLLKSTIKITLVGDPRQYTFSTNHSTKNKQFRGAGFINWVDARTSLCQRVDRHVSARCEQEICDFASQLFPELPPLEAEFECVEEHRGIHKISPHDVHEYVAAYRPTILRHDVRANTLGYPAMNIGVSKGSTFDRVLIFTTKPMRLYLEDGDLSKLSGREKLYVGVTRARWSAAFVV